MKAIRLDTVKGTHRYYHFKKAVFHNKTCGWRETGAGVPYEIDLQFELNSKDYTLTLNKKEARELFYVLLRVLVG